MITAANRVDGHRVGGHRVDDGPCTPGAAQWYAGGFGPPGPEVDGPPEPDWAVHLSAQFEREQLTATAAGPAGGWSAEVLQRWCPDGREHRGHDCATGPSESGATGPAELDAAGLVDGIAGLQRLINWAPASQQRYLAALARPGVALPVRDLMDVVESPLGLHRPLPDGATPGSMLSDPVWGPAVRQTCIKVAAVQVGCALHLAPTTARSRVERAVSMVDHLPATIAAQQAGDLDGYRAGIIYERTVVLPPEQRHTVETRILPGAVGRAASRIRELADREVTRIDPDAAARREQQARRGRGVSAERGEDGMGCVRADLSAADAQVTIQVLDRIAAAVQAAGLALGRGRSQIRADVFTDLFRDLAATGTTSIGGIGGGSQPCDAGDGNADDLPTGSTRTGERSESGPSGDGSGSASATSAAPHVDRSARQAASRSIGRATGRWRLPICINVYVHAATLAGWDDHPAEIAGHGIITADLARALAESARSVRAIAIHPPHPTTHAPPGSPAPHAPIAPEGWSPTGHATDPIRSRWCGTVLDAGRSVYRAPAELAGHVTTRDRTCSFPGCRSAASNCDLDHRLPWGAGGATCPCNQDALCRFHHLIKTFTAWRATPGSDGGLVWTSPAGRHYPSEPGHPLLDEVGIHEVGIDDAAASPHPGYAAAAGNQTPCGAPPPDDPDPTDQPPPF